MSTLPNQLLTPQEYLAQERLAEFKSEFFRGETFAMAGASRRHNLIAGNLVRELGNALKQQPCEVYPGDMRVKVCSTGLYTCPDVSIVCDDPRFEDDELDTLLNPMVLFEVLSKSTEAYDRGTKSGHYRKLPSLRHYVLVAQDRCSIDVYTRRDEGNWLLRETSDIKGSLELPWPGITIPASEVYRKVDFEAPDESDDAQRRPG